MAQRWMEVRERVRVLGIGWVLIEAIFGRISGRKYTYSSFKVCSDE